MKKAIALAVCMLLIPFTAFSMEMVSDEEMDNVTGQSGVAITIDDVVIHESGDDETWYQNSFTVNGTDSQAAIGLVGDGTESMMYVNALTGVDNGTFSSPDTQPKGDYTTLFDGGFDDYDVANFEPSALTIRVRNVAADDVEGSAFATVGKNVDAVIIGLPTVEIANEGSDVKEIFMSDAADPINDTADNQNSFGKLYSTGGGSMAILDGQIEITPFNDYATR